MTSRGIPFQDHYLDDIGAFSRKPHRSPTMMQDRDLTTNQIPDQKPQVVVTVAMRPGRGTPGTSS